MRASDRGLGLCLPAMAIARYQREDYAGARAVADRAVGIQPRFWLGEFAGWTPYADPAHRAHVAAGLRKAGLG